MAAFAPVPHMLEATVDRSRDAIVLVHDKLRVSYRELEEQANRIAACLVDRGVGRGDRVALLADNGLDYVAAFFGILKAGGCVVALNGANKAPTLNKLLLDSGAVGLVTRAAQVRRDLPVLVDGCQYLRFVLIDRINPKWELDPALEMLATEGLQSFSAERVRLELGPEDLAAIIYTSGSTGLPRGATLTHGNLAANTEQILAYLELGPDDSVMVVLPFHYSFGNSLLLTHVKVGGCLVVDNRFAYPQVILETMQREGVTGFSGVPSTYAILASKTEFLNTDLPSLRYVTQAGGAMTPALTRRVREGLDDRIRLFVMYGQTEASARLSWLPPERLLEKLGSIGIPIPGVELTIRRPDGSKCDVDEVGELVAAGDNIMRGYWNDPGETAAVLKPDGLHTGDLGREDSDGFIFLVDRIKNMIKVGAHRVSAKEIEEAIAEVDGVVEVCVVGVPDELLGEAIEAFVVPQDDGRPDAQAVQRHCREALAQFKIPRAVHFRDALPKTAAGKVIKAKLQGD